MPREATSLKRTNDPQTSKPPIEETDPYLNRSEESKRTNEGDKAPPITDFDHLTPDQITAQIESLNPDELLNLKVYEQNHQNRSGVIEAINRRLNL